MGLLDIFRRPRAAPPTTPEEWQARGRLEAAVSRLELEWVDYRDQLRRLAARIEKRDQRAAARDSREASEHEGAAQHYDELEAQRELFRRRQSGLLP